MLRIMLLGCTLAMFVVLAAMAQEDTAERKVSATEATEPLTEKPVEPAVEAATPASDAPAEQPTHDAARVVEITEPPAATGPHIELYAIDTDGQNARPVAAIKGYPIINSPEISPDGKWMAVDGWRHGETLTDAKLLFINMETWQARDMGYGCMQTWSSDGRWFGISKYGTHGTQRGVFVREFNGSQERLIDSDGWAIQWSPDGLKVAFVQGGNIVVHDFISNSRHSVFPTSARVYRHILHNMTWSPDSKRICFLGYRGNAGQEVAIVSAVGGDPKLRVRCDGARFLPDIAWHPDGERIAMPTAATKDHLGRIEIFDADGTDPPRPLPGQPADRHNQGLCWSRDGKTLYFVSVK